MVNVGRALFVHVCTKNEISFLLIAVKASNFAGSWRFANKFYTSICLLRLLSAVLGALVLKMKGTWFLAQY